MYLSQNQALETSTYFDTYTYLYSWDNNECSECMIPHIHQMCKHPGFVHMGN